MKKLGQFEVTGDKLMVTDPCYKRGTWCQGIIDNVLQGMWSGFVKYEDNDEGGTVSEVLAQHPSYTPGVRPGDTDAEYFADYTEKQLEFANSSDCEYLQLYTMEE